MRRWAECLKTLLAARKADAQCYRAARSALVHERPGGETSGSIVRQRDSRLPDEGFAVRTGLKHAHHDQLLPRVVRHGDRPIHVVCLVAAVSHRNPWVQRFSLAWVVRRGEVLGSVGGKAADAFHMHREHLAPATTGVWVYCRRRPVVSKRLPCGRRKEGSRLLQARPAISAGEVLLLRRG